MNKQNYNNLEEEVLKKYKKREKKKKPKMKVSGGSVKNLGKIIYKKASKQ